MKMFKFFHYVLLGIIFGLVEWLLLNVAPVFGMVRWVLLCAFIYLLRGHVGAALIIGCVGMLIRDVGSFSFSYPVYVLLFLVLAYVLSLFSQRIISHQSMLGFALYGFCGFFTFRVMSDIAIWFSSGSLHSFSFLFWTEILISFMIYIVIVGVLHRRWRVLRVDW